MYKNFETLIEEKKYQEIKKELSIMNEYDIASIIEELPKEELIKIFRLLSKDMASDVFAYLEPEVQKTLITSLTEKEAVNILNNMYADDATDLIEEMPAGMVTKLLSKVDKETRRDINLLLKYPDNSAGSIMTVELIDLVESYTVKEALNKIRKEITDQEIIDTCFVIDKKRKLLGTVSLKDILKNDNYKTIKEIMEENVISVNTLVDQEEVASIMQDYDLTSMPVVDSENRLVGVITVDDIIDIIEQETTEDIEKMAAIVPTEKPYLKTSVFEIWKSRIPWLLLLMVSATFTGKIISHFEESLAACVTLTAFIPMIMDTGGNAGGQTSATIIRGISINELEFKDIFKIIWKEIRVALMTGITLALCNFIKLIFLDKIAIDIAIVICSTLIFAIVIAKSVGCMLPMLAKKIGFDPAVMASPFITTIVDALSLLVYFRIACAILHI